MINELNTTIETLEAEVVRQAKVIRDSLENEKKLNIENERLTNELDKTRLSELEKEVKINKAIVYIKRWQNFPHTNGSTHTELQNLIDILKGEDID